MKDFDEDGNGEISYQEFFDLVQRLGEQEDNPEVRKAFQMFDTDGDGSITAGEFKKTMRKLGLRLTDGQIYAMVEEADVNGDGEIDYKEFTALVADTKLIESKSHFDFLQTLFGRAWSACFSIGLDLFVVFLCFDFGKINSIC